MPLPAFNKKYKRTHNHSTKRIGFQTSFSKVHVTSEELAIEIFLNVLNVLGMKGSHTILKKYASLFSEFIKKFVDVMI